MGEVITFKRPDGKDCPGYYVRPSAGDTAPGIVVIQEWWGVNNQIKGVAERLASLGYRALVPDLYRGKVTLEVAEAEHLMKNLNFGDAATQDVRGAIQHLKQRSAKVGITGFCMGGALTVLAAVHAREADAAVCWYGFPPPEAADVRTIAMPFQAHFAEEDEFFPAAQARALEARLKEGKVNYEIYWYKAKHAFANETGPNHNPESASLAWLRTVDFFARYLKK